MELLTEKAANFKARLDLEEDLISDTSYTSRELGNLIKILSKNSPSYTLFASEGKIEKIGEGIDPIFLSEKMREIYKISISILDRFRFLVGEFLTGEQSNYLHDIFGNLLNQSKVDFLFYVTMNLSQKEINEELKLLFGFNQKIKFVLQNSLNLPESFDTCSTTCSKEKSEFLISEIKKVGQEKSASGFTFAAA